MHICKAHMSTAETPFYAWWTHFLHYCTCITCINVFGLASISFIDFLHGVTVGQPSFMLHLIYFIGPSQRNPPEVIANTLSFHSPHAFLLPPPPNLLPLFPSPAPTLSFCLNLLSLMSPSRESQARKKGRGLTEIDVWALPLIRWLNPSINMQRRCPMQMDPIRRNGGVLSVRCGEW